MSQVNEHVKLIRETAVKVGEIYEAKIKKSLEQTKNDIQGTLNELVNRYAEKNGLVLTNDSSKEVKLFEISGRVKERESLVEKIIRKHLYAHFEGKENNEIVEEIYSSIDDLIGLRFLVSLSCDCQKVFTLIREHQEELKESGIEFGADIDHNPQKMQNGRPIFRIKGKKGKIPFELQIKSKVDSAWADIEHMLFYKDYQFSYIQNTNKSVMNKIGDLLSEVDKLMIQIRDSQLQFEDEREQLEFNQHLGSSYKDFLKNKIISANALRENKLTLFALYKSFTAEEQKRITIQMDRNDDSHINRDFFEFILPPSKTSTLIENYQKLRGNRIEFILFEDIYLDWVSSLEDQKEILNKELNDDILKKYLAQLTKTIIKSKTSDIISHIDDYQDMIFEDSINDFAENLSDTYIDVISALSFNTSCDRLLFNSDLIYMYFCYWQTINNCDDWAEIDDSEAQRIKLDQNVVRFLLDEGCLNEIWPDIFPIVYQVYSDQVDEKLVTPIDNEYNKRACTESGKNPMNDIIKTLFETAILNGVDGEGDE